MTTKFDNKTILTITAPSCSGKNYLMDALEAQLGFSRVISYTTRKMRAGEVQGKDYYFVSRAEWNEMESTGQLVEANQFKGEMYGVSYEELSNKLKSNTVPMKIVEPNGVFNYRRLCTTNGWDLFTLYVSLNERERIQRLNERTLNELKNSTGPASFTNTIERHTERLLSITNEERSWSNITIWDCIVPGDDVKKALAYVQHAITNRNFRSAQPVPYNP